MKRFCTLTCLAALLCLNVHAQTKTTVAFAVRDTCTLYMDIYTPDKPDTSKPAVIFAFGGGFVSGDRVKPVRKWSQTLNNDGITLISIDYRLGLKGVKPGNIVKFIKQLDLAIDMAVEDLFSATAFLIEHGAEYGIDPDRLIVSGSSAGAITSLQAEYEICNGGPLAAALPEGFNYAGVMAFSGAIFDNHNPLKFKTQPCPILMLHGTCDKIVPYKKIAIFNLCFGGSDEIARVLKKNGWPYCFLRYEDRGHDVSTYMEYAWPRELEFITDCVMNKSGNSSDATLYEPASPELKWGKMGLNAIY